MLCAGFGTPQAVADAIDVDELPHRGPHLVLPRPGQKTIKDLVAKRVQRTARRLPAVRGTPEQVEDVGERSEPGGELVAADHRLDQAGGAG
jgi:hypothetical protein